MISRKLVKSGPSSHVIVLPKAFIDENKLKTGDSVYLERQGATRLLVQAAWHHDPRIVPRIRTIDVGHRQLRHVERDIIEAYLKNYNEIIINLEHPNQAPTVKKYIGFLVALEVVQEDAKQIIARDFLNYNDLDVVRALRRIEHIVGWMLEDLATVEKEPSTADLLFERDFEVNRMGYLLMRVLQAAAKDPSLLETLHLDPLGVIRLWSVNIHLEKLGDEAKHIGKKLKELGRIPEARAEFWAIHAAILELYRSVFAALWSGSRKTVEQNAETRLALKSRIEVYDRMTKSVELAEIMGLFSMLLSHLADINRMNRYVG